MRSRFALMLSALVCAGQALGEDPFPPPNFVLIFADDLGYGDLSCFGNKEFKTPNLDKMAAEGVRLTQFYVASPVCSPSRAALLTGKYPLRVGLPNVLGPSSTIGIRPEFVTLPEALKTKGYETAIVGKWHLGHLPQFLPTRHGFDSYMGIPYSNDMKPAPLMRGETIIEQQVDQTTLTQRYTAEAVKIIRGHAEKKKPFFLYLPHNFPHVPLFASERFLGKSGGRLYGDVVMELDWSVGEVLKALRETGQAENTLVVFTSDNGPWLIQGSNAGSAGPYRDGKGTAYEGGIRVPFIAWWPGRLKPGTVIDAPASAMDVMPTFCELASASLSDAGKIDGQSIWKLLTQPGGKEARTLYFPNYYGKNYVGAVRQGDWKLHVNGKLPANAAKNPTSTRKTDDPELFNMVADPYETTNLALQHADVVTSLTAMCDAMRQELTDEDPWKDGEKRDPKALRYVTPGTQEYMGTSSTLGMDATPPTSAPKTRKRERK